MSQPGEDVTAASLRQRRMFWAVSLAIALGDQLTKAIIRATLSPNATVPVVPGFIDLIQVHNSGIAFGFLNDLDLPYKGIITTALAAAALFGIAFYARHLRDDERYARVGLSLILGGAVGNLIDRIRIGYVEDFVDMYVRGWHFWAFNVADASITIGAVLVFADLLLVTRHASHPV